MDHPLINECNSDIRKRVIQLLKTGYSVRRAGNIVFVCGGNKPTDMRMRFKEYCSANLTDFEIFLPEYAMENYFSGDIRTPFDIADFEELIGELSHAIVIFPEAPGSFAETGYFSAIGKLAEKSILVLDFDQQKRDSFISMGPAKKIGAKSRFYPVIQMIYKSPRFDDITERIKRIGAPKTRKALIFDKFKNLSKYELMCVIHKVIQVLSIATVDDIIYMLRAIFGGNQFNTNTVQQIMSILAGSSYIFANGDYGHYFVNKGKRPLLDPRTGHASVENGILIELAQTYQHADADFLNLIESARAPDTNIATGARDAA